MPAEARRCVFRVLRDEFLDATAELVPLTSCLVARGLP